MTARARLQVPLSPVLPQAVCVAVLRALDVLALRLVSLGVSANGVTWTCIALGAVAGVLLSFGRFGAAAIVMIAASLGDALDGIVARRSASASVGGALLDASGDRYQELFLLGGLAVCFRDTAWALVLTLSALGGSFMVSYSSAKAEAAGVPVPRGVMRRAERAACLCVGALAAAPWGALAAAGGFPSWMRRLPVLAALGLIAVIANASAVRRLHYVARATALRASHRPAHGSNGAARRPAVPAP
jgi:CDP-diacylglycerol---glycerol-3-phosphate 3-phosphatidyltransferase